MGMELKIIEMKCPSCGGSLEISSGMDRFACGYCGASLAAVRQGGTVSLGFVSDAIAKVQIGTDRTAAELSLRRLSEELLALKNERISQLEARREIEAQWAQRRKSIQNSGGFVPMLVAAFGIGTVVFAMVNAVAPKIPDLGILIGFLTGFVTFGFLLFFLQRKIDQAVADLNQQRDHEFASVDELLIDLQHRIDAKSEKQNEWRRLVDS